MSEAPDGTPLEVRRNFGKPNTASQILEKLRSDKKQAKRAATGPRQAAEPEVVVKPAPAAHADDLHALAATIRKENESKVPAAAPPAGLTTSSTDGTESKRARARSSVKSVQSVVAQAKPAAAPAASEVSPTVASAATLETPKQAAKQTPPRPPLNTKGMQPKHVVEAALFSAGKPISVEEIAQETKLSPETIKKAIKELAAEYDARDTVLEVGKAGTKWAMQVRSRAAEPAARFAPMEIAPKLLKTLALIAYHQPMKQSELVNMIGSKVYEHIPELIERGLVRAREEGATKILATTPAFPEYFGLDAEDPDQVRAVMGKLVGIEAPARPKQETVTYEEEQAPATADVPAEPGVDASQ